VNRESAGGGVFCHEIIFLAWWPPSTECISNCVGLQAQAKSASESDALLIRSLCLQIGSDAETWSSPTKLGGLPVCSLISLISGKGNSRETDTGGYFADEPEIKIRSSTWHRERQLFAIRWFILNNR
jgi:hypothetical protein